MPNTSAVCNTSVLAGTFNDMSRNLSWLGAIGNVVCEGNNGILGGNPLPFNGFAVGEITGGNTGNGTGGSVYRPEFETVQSIEITRNYTGFTLQAEAKLFLGYQGYNHFFKEISIGLRHPGTPYEQTIMKVVPNVTGAGGFDTLTSINILPYTPSPGEITAPFMSTGRYRITGNLNPQFVAPPGHGLLLEVFTKVKMNTPGSGGGGLYLRNYATGPQFWAGLSYFQLKMWHKCQ
jgi:hypothetical protein